MGDTAAVQGNLLVQCDNPEALKALLPFYRGQVKCIFIDPPCNTKSTFRSSAPRWRDAVAQPPAMTEPSI